MVIYELLGARCDDAEDPRRVTARERSVSLLMLRFTRDDEGAAKRVRQLEAVFAELGPFDAFVLLRLLRRPRTAEERKRRAASPAAAGFDGLSRRSRPRLLRILEERAALRSRRPGVWGVLIAGQDPYLIAKPDLALGELAGYLSDDPALLAELVRRNRTTAQRRFAGGELVRVPSGAVTSLEAVAHRAEEMAKGFQIGSRAQHIGPRTLFVIEQLDDLAVPLTASEAETICAQRRIAAEMSRPRTPADRQALAQAQLQHWRNFVRAKSGHPGGPNAFGLFPATTAVVSSVLPLRQLLNLFMSLEAFIEALIRELRKRLGADDLAALADQFDSAADAVWLVTGFGPTFAVGVIAGAASEAKRMAGELIDTIVDPVGTARAVVAALELFSSDDGPDVARALGADVGAAEAKKIAALARRNSVSFAYGLGELVGPLLVQVLLALAGAAAVAAANRFARTLRALERTRVTVAAAGMRRTGVPEGLARADHAVAGDAKEIGRRGTAERAVAAEAQPNRRRGTAAPAVADGRPTVARRLSDWLPIRLPWNVEETARLMRHYRGFAEARPTMRGYVTHFDDAGRAIASHGTPVRDALHRGGLPGRTADDEVSYMVRLGSRMRASPWGVDVYSGADAHKRATDAARRLEALARQDRDALQRLFGIPDEWAKDNVSTWSEVQIVAVAPSRPDTRLGLPSRGVAYWKGWIAPQHEHGTTWAGASRESTTVPGGGQQVLLDPLAQQEGRLKVLDTIPLPRTGHPDRAISGTIEGRRR